MRAPAFHGIRCVVLLAIGSVFAACAVVADIPDTGPRRDGSSETSASDGAVDTVQQDTPSTVDVPRCTAAQTDCNDHCVDTRSDPNNCGACGTMCPSGMFCDNGSCALTCNAPRMVCTTGSTPVCTDTQTDSMNCGACGTACATGQSCVAGVCTCPMGTMLCGGMCLDVSADIMNCGACGNACAAAQRCIAGNCVCPGGGMLCSGACVDVMNDSANCGSCGNACPAGQMCSSGACSCAPGQTSCSGACVDTRVDIANCGSCGNACGAGQFCSVGTCYCPSGRILCGGACVDVNSDTNNCGSCGTVCPSGIACSAGSCACPSGGRVCGGACVNVNTDANNCGSCGNACAGVPCTGGVCGCPGGQTACSGTCVDTSSDRNNCGACGTVCAAGQNCVSGTCRAAAPTGYSVGSSPQTFINACTSPGQVTYLASVDDSYATFTSPFAFYLWDYNGTQAWVSSNGVFGGGTTTSSQLSTTCPLGAGAPQNAVLAFLDDLVQRGGVCVATVGTAPNRKLVATWNDAQWFLDTTGHLTFSVIISEGSNIIDVVYSSMSGGGTRYTGNSAEIGVTNTGPTAAVAYSCDTSSVSSGTAIRFTPM